MTEPVSSEPRTISRGPRRRSVLAGAPGSGLRILFTGLLVGAALTAAAAPAPAVELCDGRDEDRDGTLDPGCPSVCDDPRAAGGEIRLSAEGADASIGRARSLTWDGRRYAAVWVAEDGFDTTVKLIRTGPSGRRLHDPLALSDPVPIDADPVIDAGGTGYGIAWSQEDFGLPQVLFAHVDGDGTLDAGPVVVGDPNDEGQRPAIVWDGEAFAIAWAWYNSRVYLQRLDASGSALAEERCLNCDDAGGAGDVSIAVGPEGLAVAYDDGGGSVKLVRTDADGEPLGPPTTLAEDTARRPSVVRAEGAWAVAWYDRRDGQDGIYLDRVDDAGGVLGPEVELDGDSGAAWDPSLAWTGSELLAGWAGADGTFSGLFLRRLDPTGQPLGPTLRLPGGEYSYPRCTVVWNGSRPALLRDTDEIALDRAAWLRLVDCCRDRDADGVSECDGDCDDTDALVSPDLSETCDGRDDDCDGALDEGCDGACDGAGWEPEDDLGAQGAPGVGLAARGGEPPACLVRSEPAGGSETVQLERGGPPWTSDPLEEDPGESREPTAARAGDTCAAVWRDARGGTAALRFGAREAADGTAVALDVDLGLDDAPAAPSLARTGRGLAIGYAGGSPRQGRWTRVTAEGARLLASVPLGEKPAAGASGAAAVATAPRLDGPGNAVAHLNPGRGGSAVRLELRGAYGGLDAGPVLVAEEAAGREDVAVSSTGSGFLVAWATPPVTGAPTEIFLRAYDDALSPLGPATRLTEAGGPADAPAIAFTGGELVVVFRDARDGSPRPYRARVDAAGHRLGPDASLGGDRDVGPPRAAWSGGAVWTAWTYGTERSVRPGRITCSASPSPDLVRGLRFVDEQTLRWEPVEAAVYDVVSGDLASLAVDGDFSAAVDACEASDLNATELAVADLPLPRFYLVRAVVDGIAGSYDADGPVPTPDRDPGIAASPDACP